MGRTQVPRLPPNNPSSPQPPELFRNRPRPRALAHPTPHTLPRAGHNPGVPAPGCPPAQTEGAPGDLLGHGLVGAGDESSREAAGGVGLCGHGEETLRHRPEQRHHQQGHHQHLPARRGGAGRRSGLVPRPQARAPHRRLAPGQGGLVAALPPGRRPPRQRRWGSTHAARCLHGGAPERGGAVPSGSIRGHQALPCGAAGQSLVRRLRPCPCTAPGAAWRGRCSAPCASPSPSPARPSSARGGQRPLPARGLGLNPARPRTAPTRSRLQRGLARPRPLPPHMTPAPPRGRPGPPTRPPRHPAGPAPLRRTASHRPPPSAARLWSPVRRPGPRGLPCSRP